MTVERICFAMVYLAEAMMAGLYYERLFAKKKSDTVVMLCILAAHCALFILSFADSLALNAFGFFLANLLLLAILYQCDVKSALFHSAFMSFIMIGAEIVVSLLLGLIVSRTAEFDSNFSVYAYNFTVLVTMAAGSKLLYFFGIMLSVRLLHPHTSEHSDTHFTLLLCSLPVASMLVVATIVFVGMNFLLSGWLEVLMAACVFALLAVNILVLMIYDSINRLNAEKTALMISAVKDKANLEYYNLLSKQYNDQRIFIHDFKNHLSVLGGLSAKGKNDEITQYLRNLSALPELKTKLKICADPVLNMMLITLSQRCAEEKISFNYQLRAENFDFMDAVSVSSLFGNLLSNAYEAAANSEEKIIELSIFLSDTGNNLVISLENSCAKAPVSGSRHRFVSTKNDRSNHGIGILSIERVVEKYKGISRMYYDAAEKRFHSVINIPIA